MEQLPVVCPRRGGTSSDQRLDLVGREDSEERWLKVERVSAKSPLLAKNARNGAPGRVLKWIFERCDGKVHAKDTPIGRLPEVEDLDTTGLDLKGTHVDELLSVDIEGWLAEVPLIKDHFARFGTHLPEGLNAEVKNLEDRLRAAKK